METTTIRENEIFHSIGQYVLDNINHTEWSKATLLIDIGKSSVGLKGFLTFLNGVEGRFDAPGRFQLALEIMELHRLNSGKTATPWNKIKFVLHNDYKFELEYSWDQAFQDLIDG